jgi:hypothetical protein
MIVRVGDIVHWRRRTGRVERVLDCWVEVREADGTLWTLDYQGLKR